MSQQPAKPRILATVSRRRMVWIGGMILVASCLAVIVLFRMRAPTAADTSASIPQNPIGPGGTSSAKPSVLAAESGAVSIGDLLEEAAKLYHRNRCREAEIILTRAVQTDRDDLRAWRSLAAVQRKMAEESLAKKNFLPAAQALDRARTSVNAIEGISINPVTPKMDPKIVLEEHDANEAVAGRVQQAIDQDCDQHIDSALACGDDAYHSLWNLLALGIRPVKNDRDKVIEGLTDLKQVFQLGAWASERTRMKANDAYSSLKKLVYPEEWNDLLARAGFDPVSRDTLKKWGLE